MKILSLVGARPQFIKEAVLHEEFQKRSIKEILVHSGQHYDFNMSDVFFKVLNIHKPDYNLNVGSGPHGKMIGKIMISFEEIVVKEMPDIIIVYGDTNTTLAGALVGAKLKIPVAHVEAGLRQKPKDMPEEINRVVTDHVSSYLFCPSKLAVENLKNEGVKNGIYFTGDVMYDLFLKMESLFNFDIVEKFGLSNKDYVLCTIHRDFNTDDPRKLSSILTELEKISKDITVVFPMHPRTRKRVEEFSLESKIKSLMVIDPVDYLSMMGLVKNSKVVITDSGGLQKEAFFAGKRAIVVMPDTAWRELIEMKWNILENPENISKALLKISEIKPEIENVYGNGKAGENIVEILCKQY
ncbi:non-hydrolyzing UDP-N-acetylglucosamine 2-epimerase [Thermosipho atlanticus]|uniref:UDP-N-acetylglucosamine 2-epimerase (Non-hydrolysing) n=1 Tax=Thermosipho atlanticus DSM 15807 TaxID=1123380 RepID=A0A1M5RPC5_9BACT|nr:UDP-N-acetylglucosamine 2-epimerase (non-hydrolyzing) [Thermosipho atlanticus]SHH28092.1 UDP-N-acetylglucosamine 2-epimerase (non-hydrolysing) [Thermosipho atlanticus DSM 15807]